MGPPKENVLFYDSFSILVINTTGKIRRLYTPFRVQCQLSLDHLSASSTLYVDEVFEDTDDLLLYKINGNLYPYYHFAIRINF